VTMPSFISLLVNDEEWEVRRFSGEYYHRRPNRTVWLPGIPPQADIEQVDKAYERLELRPGNQPLHDTDSDEGRSR
jgi:hypothetical protein